MLSMLLCLSQEYCILLTEDISHYVRGKKWIPNADTGITYVITFPVKEIGAYVAEYADSETNMPCPGSFPLVLSSLSYRSTFPFL